MSSRSFIQALALAGCSCGFALGARAGDEVVTRKQFHQSAAYPYVFQAESYLASTAPAPLHFQPGPADCAHRSAPALPPIPQKIPPEPIKNADLPSGSNPALSGPGAAYPPPAAAATPPSPPVDFSKVPDEVLEFFRQTDGQAVKRIYLFDPIFQPVRPNDLPPSKATYTQSP